MVLVALLRGMCFRVYGNLLDALVQLATVVEGIKVGGATNKLAWRREVRKEDEM